jgi:hypothetical protein
MQVSEDGELRAVLAVVDEDNDQLTVNLCSLEKEIQTLMARGRST